MNISFGTIFTTPAQIAIQDQARFFNSDYYNKLFREPIDLDYEGLQKIRDFKKGEIDEPTIDVPFLTGELHVQIPGYTECITDSYIGRVKPGNDLPSYNVFMKAYNARLHQKKTEKPEVPPNPEALENDLEIIAVNKVTEIMNS